MIDLINELEKRNVILISKEISPASPIIIKENIPFLNGDFDFSRITGSYNYTNRPIKLRCSFLDINPNELLNFYNNIQTFLLNNSEVIINFHNIKGYYKGNIVSFSKFEDVVLACEFEINIDAQPFRYIEFANDIWDDFNFEFDVTEIKKYEVINNKTFNLVNMGNCISPITVCSNEMNLTINNKTFNLKQGKNYIRRLKLKNGENYITVNGSGTIEFLFDKELL